MKHIRDAVKDAALRVQVAYWRRRAEQSEVLLLEWARRFANSEAAWDIAFMRRVEKAIRGDTT